MSEALPARQSRDGARRKQLEHLETKEKVLKKQGVGAGGSIAHTPSLPSRSFSICRSREEKAALEEVRPGYTSPIGRARMTPKEGQEGHGWPREGQGTNYRLEPSPEDNLWGTGSGEAHLGWSRRLRTKTKNQGGVRAYSQVLWCRSIDPRGPLQVQTKGMGFKMAGCVYGRRRRRVRMTSANVTQLGNRQRTPPGEPSPPTATSSVPSEAQSSTRPHQGPGSGCSSSRPPPPRDNRMGNN